MAVKLVLKERYGESKSVKDVSGGSNCDGCQLI
jgi:hypothetical protein